MKSVHFALMFFVIVIVSVVFHAYSEKDIIITVSQAEQKIAVSGEILGLTISPYGNRGVEIFHEGGEIILRMNFDSHGKYFVEEVIKDRNFRVTIQVDDSP